MRNFPKQRLSFNDKIKDDYKWCKTVIDNLLTNYSADRSIMNSPGSLYDKKLANYRLYNNILDQADFERECNPLGLEVGQFRDEIQPYNKTYNKIQVLLDEENKRPFKYKVIVTDPDSIRTKLAYRDGMFRNYVLSQVQNTLSQVGIQFDSEEALFDPSTLIDPSEVDKFMSTKFKSAQEIAGGKLLAFLEKKLNIRELKNDAFKHGLISGEEFVYISKRNNLPHIEVVNSLGLFYHKSAETKYIQDSLYAGYRTYMTSGDVLDNFGSFLSEDELSRIDLSRDSFGSHYGETLNSNMEYYHENSLFNNYYTRAHAESSYYSNQTISFD